MATRISTQARAVLNVLAEKRCHLTAEEILESIWEEHGIFVSMEEENQ